MKASARGLVTALALTLSGACLADDLKAEQKFGDTTVGFDLAGQYSNLTLTVAGPSDFHASAFSNSGAPTIDLSRFGAVEDGTYTYQLTAATPERVKSKRRLDDGRDAHATREAQMGVAMSGAFRVKDGAIVKLAPKKTSDSKRDQD
jgi:hypothetical protein